MNFVFTVPICNFIQLFSDNEHKNVKQKTNANVHAHYRLLINMRRAFSQRLYRMDCRCSL